MDFYGLWEGGNVSCEHDNHSNVEKSPEAFLPSHAVEVAMHSLWAGTDRCADGDTQQR